MPVTPFAGPTMVPIELTDHDVAGDTPRETLVRHAAPLTEVLTQELDGAAEMLRTSTEEILLAALGRAIGRTIGNGWVTVDLVGLGRAMGARTLTCASEKQVSATDLLIDVRASLDGAQPQEPAELAPAELAVVFAGPVAQVPTAPRPVELRIYRSHGVLHLDWWHDLRRFFPYTVVELAEQFPLALIEVCSEAQLPTWPETQSALVCTAP